MTTTTPTTTQPAETTTTTPGTCTAEEFVEAFFVTGLVPVPGIYFTTLADGRRGACALGARSKHRKCWVSADSQGLDDYFHSGVVAGFDADDIDLDHPLYQQGYAVGQRVRALMGVQE